ncbi:hypothetical protein [Streptomyces sp. NPDC093225]|uniref:hypothetical protein n=1 Tax=Streptomyces sp. NPDC093225 TaxID=3366034 RepID=UPI00380A1BC8
MSLSLAACTGGNDPAESDGPPPTAEEIAYYDCLKGQGLEIWHTDSGAPRLDKSQPLDKVAAAEKACFALLPPPPSPQPVPPEEMAAAREETACMRREGVTWYPDPKPVTGEFDDTKLTREQVHSLKTTYAEQLRKCRRPGGSDDGEGVLGG